MRIVAIALSLTAAACSQYGQTASIAPAPRPVYERPVDAQLPIDRQVAALQTAETGCANQDASAESTQMPVIPGDPSSAVHRQLALQDSPATTAIGDPGFDTCMKSLGYQRLQ